MYRDRVEAGRRLVRDLERWRGRSDAVVLAVPRGGLPVAAEVARSLGLGLDVVLTKKIGHPHNPEFAIGAVGLTGETVDAATLAREGVSAEYVAAEIERLRELLRKRYRMYRGAAKPAAVAGKTVILVDDGAATGRTLLVAVDLLKGQGAARVVVAVPVASEDALAVLRARADEVVCPLAPVEFMAIGQFYSDFAQVTDDEALALLRGAAAAGERRAGA